MENLIWLVAIGALFFFMMRKGGGCCGGHSHGSHNKNVEKQTPNEKNAANENKASCH